MAYTTVLTDIPKQITAGESVSWAVSLSDYPASESWVLTYTLVKSGTKITITSTAKGGDHVIEIPLTTSAVYAAGEYHYQAHVSNGVERYQVSEGIITVIPDFAAQDNGYDGRSHVKKVLDALEAAIEGRADKTQMMQTVGGVQVQHMSTEEIVRLRDKYLTKYLRQRAAAGKGVTRRTIKPRFRS